MRQGGQFSKLGELRGLKAIATKGQRVKLKLPTLKTQRKLSEPECRFATHNSQQQDSEKAAKWRGLAASIGHVYISKDGHCPEAASAIAFRKSICVRMLMLMPLQMTGTLRPFCSLLVG
jgi:hypothetical protein